MEAVLTSFDQRFQAVEHALVSSQSIQNAIQSGFANANFRITVPTTTAPAPSAPPVQPPRLSAPRMTLQPFSGRQNENVQAWIVTCRWHVRLDVSRVWSVANSA
jgi:invasion protein IalB